MSCDDCRKGHVLPGEPQGTMVDGAYFSSGGTSNRAVLLFADALGLPLKNSKLIADTLATRLNCDVWAPDLFNGEPLLRADYDLVDGIFPERAEEKMTWYGQLRFIGIMITRLGVVYRNRPSVVDQRIHSFISKIKQEKGYQRLGVVGYCFGGSCAARPAATDLVDAVVICHPGNPSETDLKAMKVPASWVCAENDFTFTPLARKKAEEEYKTKGIEYEFVDYKGTAHGFACRPYLIYPEIKAAFEGALDQTVNWFEKILTA